jgi:site-specific recombinase XerD
MEKTRRHLKRFLHEFHIHPHKDSHLFYATSYGEMHRLSADTVEKMLKRYVTKCSSNMEMPEKPHCHMVRKTRAMDLYQSGVPLTHIQQLLGHENLSTTSGFYAFATLETLARSIGTASENEAVKKWNCTGALDRLLKL